MVVLYCIVLLYYVVLACIINGMQQNMQQNRSSIVCDIQCVIKHMMQYGTMMKSIQYSMYSILHVERWRMKMKFDCVSGSSTACSTGQASTHCMIEWAAPTERRCSVLHWLSLYFYSHLLYTVLYCTPQPLEYSQWLQYTVSSITRRLKKCMNVAKFQKSTLSYHLLLPLIPPQSVQCRVIILQHWGVPSSSKMTGLIDSRVSTDLVFTS